MNYKITCGIDEAGRGSWAGPVVAAAVILPENFDLNGLNDSKKLSKNTRKELFIKITSNYEFGIGFSSSKEIDEINILEATFLAMRRAINNLKKLPDYAFVDGNQFPKNFPVNGVAIIKGDQKIPSISAASVIAKVSRDNFMTKMSKIYPGYDWENNFGYGVKKHFLALKTLGISPIHRHSFRPIHNMLC